MVEEGDDHICVALLTGQVQCCLVGDRVSYSHCTFSETKLHDVQVTVFSSTGDGRGREEGRGGGERRGGGEGRERRGGVARGEERRGRRGEKELLTYKHCTG